MKKLLMAAFLGFGVAGVAQADVVSIPVIPVVAALPVLGPVAAPVLTTGVDTVGGLPVISGGDLPLPDMSVLGDTLVTPALSAVGTVVGQLPGGGDSQGGLVIPTLPPLPALPGLPQ